MTRSYITIPTLALMGFALYSTAGAQTADTLRRQLQVVTSEDVTLSEQRALPLGLKLERAKEVSLPTFTPPSVVSMNPLIASPLQLLAPMRELLPGRNDLGYINLSAGIKYNAYLSAGLRPLHTDKRVLDIFFDASYTDVLVNDLPYSSKPDGHIKEHQYQLGANYSMALGQNHDLSIKAVYQKNKHNYNAQIEDELKHSYLSFAGSIDNKRQKENPWQYLLSPSLSFTSIDGLRSYSIPLSPQETQFHIDGMLSYRIRERLTVGSDVSTEALFYKGDSYNIPFQGDRSIYYPYSSFGLRPFVRLGNEEKLFARLGVRLDNYTSRRYVGEGVEEVRLSFFKAAPDVTVGWLFAPSWRADLSLTGEINPNGLSSLFSEMPYLSLSQGVIPTYTPLKGRLSISGLLLPTFSVSAFVGFSSIQNAVNYYVMPPRENRAILFRPEQADGTEFSGGVSLRYRPLNRLTVSARGQLHKWSKDLYGRPDLEIDAALTYKPTESFELSASYLLSYGIKQRVGSSESTPSTFIEERLRTYSLFRFGASYQLPANFSVNLSGHFVPDGSSTLYFGYKPQRISANLGLSYRF